MIKKILSFIILIFMALQIPVYAVEEKPPIDVHIPIQVRDYGGTCALLMEEDGTIVDDSSVINVGTTYKMKFRAHTKQGDIDAYVYCKVITN